jgi:hypothetical protein
MKQTSTIAKKKGEKNRRAGGSTAGEFATKNRGRCSSLQTSGVILGRRYCAVNTMLWFEILLAPQLSVVARRITT